MTHIQLDRIGIDHALLRVSTGLKKYAWLQAELHKRDVSQDPAYQRAFTGFYRVRRSADWRKVYYQLLEEGKTNPPPLLSVLGALHAATGRVEASFASKLVATIDPTQPVIDSVVLGNLGLRLPARGETSVRIEGIADVHRQMVQSFSDFLGRDAGSYLVRRFKEAYPNVNVTEVKMLDLVLWQTRRAT